MLALISSFFRRLATDFIDGVLHTILTIHFSPSHLFSLLEMLVVRNIYTGIYRVAKLRHFIDISTLYECRCKKTIPFQSKFESNVSPCRRSAIDGDCGKGPRRKVCVPSSTRQHDLLLCRILFIVFCMCERR